MILPIYTSVERLDNAMVEAAYDLGAGPVRAFSQVIIPLTRPGIVAGALLVFVPSIAMFAITNLDGRRQPSDHRRRDLPAVHFRAQPALRGGTWHTPALDVHTLPLAHSTAQGRLATHSRDKTRGPAPAGARELLNHT